MNAIDGVPRLKPERYKSVWRTEVALLHNELLRRLGSVRLGATGPLTKEVGRPHLDAAKEALADAGRAVNRDDGWRERLFAWWTGSAVTAGWEALHDAEGELALLEDDHNVRAALPRLKAWLQQVVPAGDLRSRYERVLGEYIEDEDARIDRTVVRQAYQDVQIANNEWHASLRAFRNLLVLASAVLATVLVGIAAWHAINPEVVSLCGEADGGGRRCLTGDSPTGRDVLQVELVGVLGGLLSVAFGLGAVKAPPSRYNLRAAQAALKPVAGAATALIGVLLVQSNVLIAPAQTVSESLLLAYAAIFGFSQQLLTHFVDQRAGELLTGKAECE